jgi:hypothetical protein
MEGGVVVSPEPAVWLARLWLPNLERFRFSGRILGKRPAAVGTMLSLRIMSPYQRDQTGRGQSVGADE